MRRGTDLPGSRLELEGQGRLRNEVRGMRPDEVDAERVVRLACGR